MHKMIIDENNDDIEAIFNKHKNTHGNKVHCDFTKKTVETNAQLIEHFEQNGYIKKKNYYEDNEQNQQTKKEDYFSSIQKDYIDNSELYCGYLDNIDSIHLKRSKKNPKTQISCSYCFEVISNNIERQIKNIYICSKAENIFKDYLETHTLKEVIDIMEIKGDTIKELFKERNVEEEKEKMFISIKCVNCSNTIGVFDTITNDKIMYNCM